MTTARSQPISMEEVFEALAEMEAEVRGELEIISGEPGAASGLRQAMAIVCGALTGGQHDINYETAPFSCRKCGAKILFNLHDGVWSSEVVA